MVRREARLLYGALLAATAALSCRDAAGPERGAGIWFIAGDTGMDTVNTLLRQALIVEVRQDDGSLLPEGSEVHFQSVIRPDYYHETLVGSLASEHMSTGFVATTDAGGRVAAMVRLGVIAGPARVVVFVPELQRRDTVTYTIRPGNATNLVIVPADTALFVGASFGGRHRVTDAHGNIRDDDVTWTAGNSGLTVTKPGLVTTNTTGRHTYIATVDGEEPLADTAEISVVPNLRIATMSTSSLWVGVLSANLDGTGMNPLIPAPLAVYFGGDPIWMPGTDNLLVASHDANGARYLRVVEQNGSVRPFFQTLPTGIPDHETPSISANGNWVFFATYSTDCPITPYCIFRTASTGTGAVEVVNTGVPTYYPSSSPDGSHVAFTTFENGDHIRVFDIAAATVSAWSLAGTSPSWSPLGTKIAYIRNGIRMINPDGTGDEAFTSSAGNWQGPIHWSPDGTWMVVRRNDRLTLIDVASRQLLPLPWTAFLTGGSLKPRAAPPGAAMKSTRVPK